LSYIGKPRKNRATGNAIVTYAAKMKSTENSKRKNPQQIEPMEFEHKVTLYER